MLKGTYLIILLSISAFGADLVATDVDMSPASSDLSVVVLIVINLLVLIYGFKKVLNFLGR